MRVMVILKATTSSEAGTLPSAKHVAAMRRFHDELVRGGVMLASAFLHPSSNGKRVVFDGAERHVVSGPFGAPEGLVAGFWLWQVKSIDEALEWARRCPAPLGEDVELEIRPVRNGMLEA
jgi:hypothetical protein